MMEGTGGAGAQLNALLEELGLPEVDAALADRFGEYLSLILRWNARVNLTAVRDEEGILRRHFVESIVCARALPAGAATLLDFGSGGGFPGIPVALCRPEIAVTLAESQGKKAAFLNEAVRVLGLAARVHSGRAEVLPRKFDCVTLRAVDRMELAVKTAAGLVCPGGWLALMTTSSDVVKLKTAAGSGFEWSAIEILVGSTDRLLALGLRDGKASRQ